MSSKQMDILRELELEIEKARNSGLENPLSAQQEQSINTAIEHHNAGRIEQAEGIYREILQQDPNQPMPLHLLGVLAHQVGRNDVAVELIKNALLIIPDYAEAQYNLSLSLDLLGRLEEAVISCCKAILIKPDYLDAHNHLGTMFKKLGRVDEAIASFQQATLIAPKSHISYYNLGTVYVEQKRFEDAVSSYQKALELEPGFAGIYNNLGVAFKEMERLDDAVTNYQKALSCMPNFADAHFNLGNAFVEQENLIDGLVSLRRAVRLEPENDLFWFALGQSLRSVSFSTVDDSLLEDLSRLLERPTVDPSGVVKPIISVLRLHKEFLQILESPRISQSKNGTAAFETVVKLTGFPLFLQIMRLVPISDMEVERMLTALRSALLTEFVEDNIDEQLLPFISALALQCFNNEYVFSETIDEKSAVEKLQHKITALLEQKLDVSPCLLALLASYRPLYNFPWSLQLSALTWEGAIEDVIVRQILEPQEELELRPNIAVITPIDNDISKKVREQYEENPYPRWIGTGMAAKVKAIESVLQSPPFNFDLGNYNPVKSPEVLIAGCGTGQHVVIAGSSFSDLRILAVDLSLSSLSYAMRKTNELGIENVEYSQGDIMELGSLEQRFDIIESVGVLHHLGNPVAGWRVLVALLREGGLMKIGLYSETARQHIVTTRSMIADKGYSSSPDDIRQCRQDIFDLGEAGDPGMKSHCGGKDFFSLSNCRDLLFHVQEHRFTLSQIEEALVDLNLKFLGFELQSPATLKKFKKVHSDLNSQSSLSLWHKFELENPDTFSGMYQFWCQKM